jgi:hypothetical protein
MRNTHTARFLQIKYLVDIEGYWRKVQTDHRKLFPGTSVPDDRASPDPRLSNLVGTNVLSGSGQTISVHL